MSIRQTLSRLPAPLKRGIQDRVYPTLLPEGETAPEWHLQSWDDSWHRHGKHWSVLVFYQEDGGVEDRAQLAEFQAHLADFTGLGVKIFALNPAEGPSHAGGSVARQFRACLQIPTAPMYLRTVYLLNPERKIRLGNRGTPSVAAIVRSIQALQQASRSGM
jgi:alkyl hydroperoxide reductase subunit AhpC